MATTQPPSKGTQAISDLPMPPVEEVPFRLISRPERKTAKLLQNAVDQQAVKSQNKFFHFKFEESLFIFDIYIIVEGFIESSEFEYFWDGVDGVRHEGKASVKDQSLNIPVYGVASLVAFKPPKAYFTTPHIKSVGIYGFELKMAGDFVRYIERVEEIKDNAIASIDKQKADLEEKRKSVAALEAQRGALTQDITLFKSAVSREQVKVKSLESQRTELIAKSGEIERAISDSESRVEEMKSYITRSTKIRSDLAMSITKKEKVLSELEANIDLFPSELSSFSKQGSKDFKMFALLSVIPVILIAVMFILLVRGSADLTTKITGSEDINLLALAVSRAPYVAIAGAIIAASYYVAKMLILEMVRISRQRLSLTKISIIAKDISLSIDSDILMSKDERYYRRLNLKMDMMKDHLKEYLSTDFKPSLPETILPSGIANLSRWMPKEGQKDGTAEVGD
ncbi:hypothetical protein [Sphingomonas crocodyli]|uniref:Uncharacterized protein n=1 Tax=Sphingomonas crocodyli TaxID=1979270 RepID=A0A437M511_9SPHN|nr:hypothetical protein [Sphingomonas crocodyli]RVT92759.1 hypothetical protein EOD43_02220 [Sphingomonas crocodyli]